MVNTLASVTIIFCGYTLTLSGIYYIMRSVKTVHSSPNRVQEYEWRCHQMANIKSAKKRILVIATKTARNRAIKSAVKTQIKKVRFAVEHHDKAAATTALTAAYKSIDKATSKGIFHKNAAARKKSSLTRLVNAMA